MMYGKYLKMIIDYLFKAAIIWGHVLSNQDCNKACDIAAKKVRTFMERTDTPPE